MFLWAITKNQLKVLLGFLFVNEDRLIPIWINWLSDNGAISPKYREEIEENEEVEEAYTGPQAIVVTDSDKSTWESMQERLQDSPLIQEMLKNTRRFKKLLQRLV